MKNVRLILTSIVFCVLFNLILMPIDVLAIETNDNFLLEETETENSQLVESIDKKTSEDNMSSKTENAQYIDDNNVQKVKVITTKVDENGNALSGAVLQIIDSFGNIIDEWTSDGKEHVTMLADGEYILHEKSAPEGYDLAEDKIFTVKVKVHEINAGVDHAVNENCKHYKISLYYIESEGKKQEVYCINQDWDEPIEYVYETDENMNIVKDENGNSIVTNTKTVNYNGEILSAENIKKITPDADSTMSEIELYDKLLDIIYHRSKASEHFKDSLTENEIRFITEYALKNYSSGEVTTQQRVKKNGVYVTKTIKYFRYYKYDPIEGYVIDPGNGNALGKLAQHWKTVHKSIIPAKYVELYNYLISEEDPHPSDMHLYVYSTELKPNGPNSIENDRYQNLLGISGYFSDFNSEELNLTMENKYSQEVTDITITKTWDDGENEDMIRPESVTVNIYADEVIVKEIVIGEEDNWETKISNLPVYNNGKKINYTIAEETVEFYETIIIDNSNNNFKITNTHIPWPKGNIEDPNIPEAHPENDEEFENPHTYDGIYTSIIMLLVCFVNLIGFICYMFKKVNSKI